MKRLHRRGDAAQIKPFEWLDGPVFAGGPGDALNQLFAIGMQPFCLPLCLAFCVFVVYHIYRIHSTHDYLFPGFSPAHIRLS